MDGVEVSLFEAGSGRSSHFVTRLFHEGHVEVSMRRSQTREEGASMVTDDLWEGIVAEGCRLECDLNADLSRSDGALLLSRGR